MIGEFVDHLGLDRYLSMGQDWGGPISMAVAVERADRVRGVVLGNTWFWPADTLAMKAFSRVMSSPPVQYAILRRNFFVERLIPAGTEHRPSSAVMAHYRAVQPNAAARRGVAEMPKQILAARPLLARLAREVPATLGTKPTLLIWGMKDVAFRPKTIIPRLSATFPDHVLVELPNAKHFIQEDASTGSPPRSLSASAEPLSLSTPQQLALLERGWRHRIAPHPTSDHGQPRTNTCRHPEKLRNPDNDP